MPSRPPTPPDKDPWEDKNLRFETNGTACEWGEAYHPGGYHPSHLGDTVNERYRIIRKLGWGQFSTVWLAVDTQSDRHVTLKITLARKSDSVSREVNIYQSCLRPGCEYLVALHDVIRIVGPNGEHDGLVFETMGANLNTFLQKRPEFQIGDPWERRFTIEFTKRALLDVTRALDFVHNRGVVHGDLHLDNILTCIETPHSKEELQQQVSDARPLKRRDGREDLWAPSYLLEPKPLTDRFSYELRPLVKLADLGGAFEAKQAIAGATAITPVALRAPEAILGDYLGKGIDIWCIGCLVFEMVVGRPLFVGIQSLEGQSYDEISNDEHLVQLWDVIGPLPKSLREKWRRADQYFSSTGERLQGTDDLDDEPPSPTQSDEDLPLACVGNFQSLEDQFRAEKPGTIDETEEKEILQLLRWAFQYDPAQRPTTKDILHHPWFRED
ncbi:hypothetical protein ACHAP5_007229 [Fusarium lateritium]